MRKSCANGLKMLRVNLKKNSEVDRVWLHLQQQS